MVMPRRHRIRVVDTPHEPVPLRAEAIAPHLAESSPPAVFGADRARDGVVLIDESERTLTAAELFSAAFAGGDDEDGRGRRVSSHPGRPAEPRLQLWGVSTSGMPRRGSRCVRLFHGPPEVLIDRVVRLGGGTGDLRLDLDRRQPALEGPGAELIAPGTLVGAFATRRSSVRVSLRITRFNPLFSVAELTLVSRRHPRQFFSAAHAALGFLTIEG